MIAFCKVSNLVIERYTVFPYLLGDILLVDKLRKLYDAHSCIMRNYHRSRTCYKLIQLILSGKRVILLNTDINELLIHYASTSLHNSKRYMASDRTAHCQKRAKSCMMVHLLTRNTGDQESYLS